MKEHPQDNTAKLHAKSKTLIVNTTNQKELTDTKGLRYKGQFTFWAYFNTKLSELHHRTTLFTFLTTLFGLTPLGIYNCDTGKARVLALGLLLRLLRWHLSDVIIRFNVNTNGSPSWVASQLFQLQQLIGNVQFISKLNLSLLQELVLRLPACLPTTCTQ